MKLGDVVRRRTMAPPAHSWKRTTREESATERRRTTESTEKIIIEHRLVEFNTGTKLQQTGKVNERLTGLRGKKTKRN